MPFMVKRGFEPGPSCSPSSTLTTVPFFLLTESDYLDQNCHFWPTSALEGLSKLWFFTSTSNPWALSGDAELGIFCNAKHIHARHWAMDQWSCLGQRGQLRRALQSVFHITTYLAGNLSLEMSGFKPGTIRMPSRSSYPTKFLIIDQSILLPAGLWIGQGEMQQYRWAITGLIRLRGFPERSHCDPLGLCS